jgi:cytochrome d ubiquinol oxidase subunit I
MDIELLSRIQFGFTIGFHYLFPPLSIGLGLFLVIMEGIYLKTRNPLYHQMTRFWTRIFGLIFALGVASGIVMEFQFGTNWARFCRYVGDIFGSALAAEGIFAFFLESGFLAILLFGWDRVKPRTHFISTIFVCAGAHFSAVWIVVANSWQQTPAGHRIVGIGSSARAELVDFWEVVFNPSFLDRISHVTMGCWQAAAFFVLSVSAFYLLRKKHVEFARGSIKIALVIAAIASCMQLVTGHHSAVTVAGTQPAKMAAYEGHYEENAPADLYLMGWVDEDAEKTVGVRIPGLLSYLITGDTTRPVTGLKAYTPGDRPPVNLVFQSYHLMVAIGMFLILLSSYGLFCWWRNRLFECRILLRAFVAAVILPMLANQLGWFSAEVGRQPWIVYGILRTSEGLSTTVGREEIIVSLILYTAIYALLFVLFFYLLNEKIQQGPMGDETVREGHLA